MKNINCHDALKRLQEGNRHFAEELTLLRQKSPQSDKNSKDRRLSLLEGQSPFAIILGCADSRVPAEIVFDQGLGDLFVIRVAGNIIAPSLVESVEFAAERFHTKLVVVLGHTQCGAVRATFESIATDPNSAHQAPFSSIVERIRPSFQNLLLAKTQLPTVINDWAHDDKEQLIDQATRANIRASASHLRHGSRILEELIDSQGLCVVGAEYSLETGLVDFFDGVP